MGCLVSVRNASFQRKMCKLHNPVETAGCKGDVNENWHDRYSYFSRSCEQTQEMTTEEAIMVWNAPYQWQWPVSNLKGCSQHIARHAVSQIALYHANNVVSINQKRIRVTKVTTITNYKVCCLQGSVVEHSEAAWTSSLDWNDTLQVMSF